MTTDDSTDATPDGLATAGICDEVTLFVPIAPHSAAVVRSAIRRVFDFGSEELESAFLIAVSELTINAVEEHQRCGIEEPVVVVIDAGIEPSVKIVDRGRGLDLALVDDQVGEHPIAPSADAGRGITIARAFVPSLAFDVSASGTSVTLPLHGFAVTRP